VTSADLLLDAFDRIHGVVHRAVDGLGVDDLTARIDPGGNSIAWLVWHLARIQDDHIAGVAGTEQAWTTDGWAERFGLPFHPAATGYGHDSDEVAAVRADAQTLLGYFDAVHARTLDYVRDVGDADLERVIDTNWDPPVTLGVRLVSVVSDDLQHAGQASLIRGVLQRRGA
jgi:Protein of unknown function (DUF664)